MYAIRSYYVVRSELAGRAPLIGFSGAPFTLSSYMVEGGKSRDFATTKLMMYEAPETWNLLMDKVCTVLIDYLNRITSYNVCYTKLLRGDQFFQVSLDRIAQGFVVVAALQHGDQPALANFPGGFLDQLGHA